jgi:hypothetical protein
MLAPNTDGSALSTRLAAALRLDLQLYLDVSGDAAATSQAFRIVLLSGLSNGIGLLGRLGAAGILAGVVAAILGWLLWAAVIWLTGTLFGQRREDRSLLRVLGFADAPGVFLILGLVPAVAGAVRFVVVVWLLATTVRAVQAVFAVTTGRAVVIAVVAFVMYLVLGAVSAYFAAA